MTGIQIFSQAKLAQSENYHLKNAGHNNIAIFSDGAHCVQPIFAIPSLNFKASK
jgi:hypothetical protein